MFALSLTRWACTWTWGRGPWSTLAASLSSSVITSIGFYAGFKTNTQLFSCLCDKYLCCLLSPCPNFWLAPSYSKEASGFRMLILPNWLISVVFGGLLRIFCIRLTHRQADMTLILSFQSNACYVVLLPHWPGWTSEYTVVEKGRECASLLGSGCQGVLVGFLM